MSGVQIWHKRRGKVEMVAEIAEIKERGHKMGFYQGWKEMLQKNTKYLGGENTRQG